MNEKVGKVVLCKRTEYPKLGYIIHRLNTVGIKCEIGPPSFHASQTLLVNKEDEVHANAVLSEKFGKGRTKSRRSIDEIPDDDPRFLPWANILPLSDEEIAYYIEAAEEQSLRHFNRIAGDR